MCRRDNRSFLRRMAKFLVASLRAHPVPPVCLQQLDEIPIFHCRPCLRNTTESSPRLLVFSRFQTRFPLNPFLPVSLGALDRAPSAIGEHPHPKNQFRAFLPAMQINAISVETSGDDNEKGRPNYPSDRFFHGHQSRFPAHCLTLEPSTSNPPYRPASINVTLLISFSVVIPCLTRSIAESRRKPIPFSFAFLRISLPGFFASSISRISSSSSSSS